MDLLKKAKEVVTSLKKVSMNAIEEIEKLSNPLGIIEKGAEFEAKRRAHPPISSEDQKAIGQEAKEILNRMKGNGANISNRDALLDAKDEAIEKAHDNYWQNKEKVREKYQSNHLQA